MLLFLLASCVPEPTPPREALIDEAWEQFLAISASDDQGELAWQGWKEAYDIFLPGGEAPAPWGEPDPVPEACAGLDGPVLRMTSKLSDQHELVDEELQAVGGEVFDQQGQPLRYEVRANEVMFGAIVSDRLYQAEVQAAFGPVDWPDGSVEIKAAWRRVTEAEAGDPGFRERYHVAEGLLYDDDGEPTCELAEVALVGFHMVGKSAAHPQFLWASFEQVDNDMVLAGSGTPNCRSTPQYCPDQTRTNVQRELAFPEDLREANARWSEWNAGTVWASYRLVGIQAPSDVRGPPDPDEGEVHAANLTMETLNQSASDCVGCHSYARTSNPYNPSDFSWFLRRAQWAGPPGVPEQPQREERDPEVTALLEQIGDYTVWGTWPRSQWNDFETGLKGEDGLKGPAVGGENPHGAYVRIFINATAAAYVQGVAEGSASPGAFPEGSVVLKENLPRLCDPEEPTQPWQPPIELTIMQKREAGYYPEGGDWFYAKTTADGAIVDGAGQQRACASCHAWTGNGDFLLTYNFGEEPVIRTLGVDAPKKDDDRCVAED